MTKVNPYIVIPLEHTILFLPKTFCHRTLNLKCLFYDEQTKVLTTIKRVNNFNSVHFNSKIKDLIKIG